jgi:hypothetical protein
MLPEVRPSIQSAARPPTTRGYGIRGAGSIPDGGSEKSFIILTPDSWIPGPRALWEG